MSPIYAHSGDHKKERNWFIEQCQILARECHLRITFLSGDVHAGACGRFHDKRKIAPEDDPKVRGVAGARGGP